MSAFDVDLKRLTESTKAWCGLNALMYTDGVLNWSHAPVTLFANNFPRESMNYSQRVQPLINQLVDKIARDRDFLLKQLTPVAEADPFTGRLLSIFKALPEDHYRRKVLFGIHRSDYMLDNSNSADNHSDAAKPLQIEINTIAASFGCLSQKTAQLHKYLCSRFGDSSEMKAVFDATGTPSILPIPTKASSKSLLDEMPINDCADKIAESIAYAHKLSCEAVDTNTEGSVVMFVVQPGERNLADQRTLEQKLWEIAAIKVEYLSLAQVAVRAKYVGPLSELFISTGSEHKRVSVVYFRAGYSPDDHTSEADWEARSLIERSAAISCPSIAYQLVGTKKIQQALFEKGTTESFLGDEDGLVLRQAFARQYAMGATASAEGLEAMESAIIDGSKWVLKPQREGGGNNYYGEELSEFLRIHRHDSELSGYILMQRIFPASQQSVFFRNDQVQVLPSISELGIYGTFIGDGETVILNDCAGYLLRTKPSGVDEGGVAAGSSVLNSVLLTDS